MLSIMKPAHLLPILCTFCMLKKKKKSYPYFFLVTRIDIIANIYSGFLGILNKYFYRARYLILVFAVLLNERLYYIFFYRIMDGFSNMKGNSVFHHTHFSNKKKGKKVNRNLIVWYFFLYYNLKVQWSSKNINRTVFMTLIYVYVILDIRYIFLYLQQNLQNYSILQLFSLLFHYTRIFPNLNTYLYFNVMNIFFMIIWQ